MIRNLCTWQHSLLQMSLIHLASFQHESSNSFEWLSQMKQRHQVKQPTTMAFWYNEEHCIS